MTGALVLLIGIPGSGKSTLARTMFRTTQITSLDTIRGQLTDNEGDQSVTPTAVNLQHALVAERCTRGLVTCVDNTNLLTGHRAELLAFAVVTGLPTYAFVFDVELDEAQRRCRERAAAGNRSVPDHVVEKLHLRKLQEVPAEGPVPGFTVTRRIGHTGVQFGVVPPAHWDAPWVL